jgi:hypothetical protein
LCKFEFDRNGTSIIKLLLSGISAYAITSGNMILFVIFDHDGVGGGHEIELMLLIELSKELLLLLEEFEDDLELLLLLAELFELAELSFKSFILQNLFRYLGSFSILIFITFLIILYFSEKF